MDESILDRWAVARSLLFVPGNRPERFENAIRSGVDAVILDLEDSVPATEKAAARSAIEREWLRIAALGVPLAVRVNALGTDEGEGDLRWLPSLARLGVVMLPKVESPDALARLRTALGHVMLLPLVLRFGFGGKLCIHPRQVSVVHGAMAPTAHELDWAQRVLAADAAAGGAAVQLDGRMVDLPVVLRARHTLARAAAARKPT